MVTLVKTYRTCKLVEDDLLGDVGLFELPTCESCIYEKMTRLPISSIAQRSDETLGIVHSDIRGPMSVNTRNGHRYFITFNDDFSRFQKVYLLHKKSKALEVFKTIKVEVDRRI